MAEKPVRQIAVDLGVNENTYYQWAKKEVFGSGKGPMGN
ncbi:MAG: hypothetical protein LBB98_01855 [Treponema sp.]|nr:hypothetical protein [Treponema sp.]